MTTFTKVSDSEKPLIEVDAEKKLSKIDPMTYGGFTEYVLCPSDRVIAFWASELE